MCGDTVPLPGSCCPIGFSCLPHPDEGILKCSENANATFAFAPSSCTLKLPFGEQCGEPVLSLACPECCSSSPTSKTSAGPTQIGLCMKADPSLGTVARSWQPVRLRGQRLPGADIRLCVLRGRLCLPVRAAFAYLPAIALPGGSTLSAEPQAAHQLICSGGRKCCSHSHFDSLPQPRPARCGPHLHQTIVNLCIVYDVC